MAFKKDIKKKTVIAFDIDGCLLAKGDKPRMEVIELLKALARNKQNTIIVWSGGGAQYAEVWVTRLGLDSYVFATCSKLSPFLKVDIAIDDEDVKLGKFNIRL